MQTTAHSFASALHEELAGHANAADANHMRDYLRGQFEFLGIRAPQRRQLLRSFLNRRNLPSLPALREVVELLWRESHREMQHCAMELLHRRERELVLEDLPLLERMITRRSWWDTVDFIAYKLVGRLLARHPEDEPLIVRRFSSSGNLWLIRVSIICQLLRGDQTNRDLLTEVIDAHRTHQDFFIRKAIGWALRDYAKTDPEWVIGFVDNSELSPLSRREALKNIVVPASPQT